MTQLPIKIVNAALHDSPKGDGSLVLMGWIDAGDFPLIQVGDYQRERGTSSRLSKILKGYRDGTPFPAIYLGMRGQRFHERDGAIYLEDPVFVIDGLQRLSGGTIHRDGNPEAKIMLAAEIHFDSTEVFEREMFRILNSDREKVNSCILLRNARVDSSAMLALYGLTAKDKNFPLYERVQWGQRMARNEIISANTYTKVIGRLHSHKAPTKRSTVSELVPALDKALDIYGIQALRENTKQFFDLVDHCWGIKRVEYRGATHLKSTFLLVLAQFLSDHHDFWKQPDEKRFTIDAVDRRKLGTFALSDPQIQNLCGSGGSASEMLYLFLKNHMDKGRRSGRTKSRYGNLITMGEDGPSEEDEKVA